MPDLPAVQIITYTFALWFGMYLLGRHFQKPGMRYTGLGLVAYALGLAIDTLRDFGISPQQEPLLRQERALVVVLPAMFWFAAVSHLIPPSARRDLPSTPLRIILIGSIFFVLSVGMAALPQAIFSSNLAVLAVGVDLVILSVGIAALDAYEEGETLLRDAVRSLGASALAALVFGGQVILAMAITGARDIAMLLLLLAVISTAIVLQTLHDSIQSLLDRLLFSRQPRLQHERERLRAVASALPRVDETLDVSTLPEQEFNRLTRRALSHMGDLKRLASSPLTRLPVIGARLAARGGLDSTLERAAELKALLAESIERLKPRQGGETGTTDEWRYYNALYYVYVLSLRPSGRGGLDGGDPQIDAVMAWFRGQVPERTLHNWQNAAAELVARDLREQNR